MPDESFEKNDIMGLLVPKNDFKNFLANYSVPPSIFEMINIYNIMVIKTNNTLYDVHCQYNSCLHLCCLKVGLEHNFLLHLYYT